MHFMQEYGIKEHSESDEHIDVKIQTENTHAILTVLLIAHIFSYVTQLYRNWEIEQYGKLDINGVSRAKKEFILRKL